MLNHFISGRYQPKPIFGICRTSNKSMAAILSLSSCSIRSRTSPGSVQPYLHLKIIIIGLTFQFISLSRCRPAVSFDSFSLLSVFVSLCFTHHCYRFFHINNTITTTYYTAFSFLSIFSLPICYTKAHKTTL